MANILVVDDELGIRDLLSEILNDEGHSVELAENAAQARAARQRARPDLVLLDIWMPDTDGVTLLKAVDQALAKPAAPARATASAVAMPAAAAVQAAHAVGVAQAGDVGVMQAAIPAAMMAMPMEAGPQPRQIFGLDKPLREARDEFEKCYFEFHLSKEGGSMTRVAEKTGLERTHLYRKLKQLGVDLSRGKRGG